MTSIFAKLASSRNDCPRHRMSYRTAGSCKATFILFYRYIYDERTKPLDSSIVWGTGCATRTPRATKPFMWFGTCIFSMPVSGFLPPCPPAVRLEFFNAFYYLAKPYRVALWPSIAFPTPFKLRDPFGCHQLWTPRTLSADVLWHLCT